MTEKLSITRREQTIEDNLRFINDRIAEAAEKSGRTRDDIRLMAVTKTVEPVFINHAIACGIDLIGENYVQELLGKKDFLHLDGVDVHLIGHLQTNKVRQIVGLVDLIQSVDSEALLQKIDSYAEKRGVIQDVLIEVNIGGEEAKSGVDPSALDALLQSASNYPHLHVRGLMAIPPISTESGGNHDYFCAMHQLFIDIGAKKYDNVTMDFLSMGMSDDFEDAIRCGANMVRVGSSIFGARHYTT